MYNQKLISYFGESKIRELLETGNYKISLFTLDKDNINLRNAIENYILKYISMPNSEKEKQGMKFYLDSLYKAFMNNPEIYSYTFLLKKSNAARVFTSEQLLKINQMKNKISNSAYQIYNESKNRPLSNKEKNVLMTFFIENIDSKNEKISKAIEDYARRITASDAIPENDCELKFILYYFHNKMLTGSTFGNADNKIECTIYLMEKEPNNGGYYTNDTIFINRKSYDYCNTLSKLLECVCHETEHAIQDYKSKNNPNSVVGYEFAVYNLLFRHYKTEEYNPYKDNYRYSDIEKDAEIKGYQYASSIYYQLGHPEKAKELKDIKRNSFNIRAFEYEYIKDENGYLVPKETYNVTHMNAIMQKHPEYIMEYPVLKQTYHKDGTVKSFEEMLATDIKANDSDYYRIYADYLTYYVKQGKLDDLNITNLEPSIRANVVKHIIMLFNEEMNVILSMIDNTQAKVTDKQKEITSGYHLKIASRLSEFLSNNYQIIEEMTERNELGGFIDVNRYKNDIDTLCYYISKYDKDDGLKRSIEKYADKFTQSSKKMYDTRNWLYIQKKLKNYDDETLKSQVTLPSGAVISFEQYCEEYIFGNMNKSREFVSENGETMPISQAMEETLNQHHVPINLTADQIEELKQLGYFEDSQTIQNHDSSRHR